MRTTIHLYLITLFHPERFLNCRTRDLSDLPHILRDRNDLETTRIDHAKSHELPVSFEEIHGRVTAHTGRAVYSLRRTWISSIRLNQIMEEYGIRLVKTRETGTQAEWRCEFRWRWADQEGGWPELLKRRLIEGVNAQMTISIRQMWRNPSRARIDGRHPLAVPHEMVEEVANLVIGPRDAATLREASVDIRKANESWWLDYDL